jgi:hypothetical protein
MAPDPEKGKKQKNGQVSCRFVIEDGSHPSSRRIFRQANARRVPDIDVCHLVDDPAVEFPRGQVSPPTTVRPNYGEPTDWTRW